MREWRTRASTAAIAWLNAAVASSQDEHRRMLYRTLSVEFFRYGVQFIGCDGHMLFRTWAGYSDIGDFESHMPDRWERPVDAIIVMDDDKFAIGFMRTLLSACGDDELPVELTFTIEEAPPAPEEPALGDVMTPYVLTMQALGQRLSCKLMDGEYPNWRELELGIDAAERVEGMMLSTKLFAAVGKLKGINGIDCSFHGEDRAIEISDSYDMLRGLLMPMRRTEKTKTVVEEKEEQLAHA